jgi:hypothetical protein
MSLKKATPKAVFQACERLELLDKSWNRDDVRISVGGGSFSVIDPLIQAWRKLQPIREVAPSVPTDLLIQVATMLEQQVSGYIADIDLRDKEREETLLLASEALTENLQQIESKLTTQLELCEQANHDLESECSRLEFEINEKHTRSLALDLELQISKEAEASLKLRLNEQQKFYEQAFSEEKQSKVQNETRLLDQYQQQLSQVKLESQQHLAQQRSEITDTAEIAENRLMRLLDKGRNELRELQESSNNKIDLLRGESQSLMQQRSRQLVEIKSLESSSLQIKQDNKQLNLQQEDQILLLKNEKLLLQQQIQDQSKERVDLGSLKDSIQLLQDQLVSNQLNK